MENDHIRLRGCSQLELIQLVLYMSSFEIYERDDCDRSHAQIYMSIWLVDFHRDLSMRASWLVEKHLVWGKMHTPQHHLTPPMVQRLPP